MSTLLPSDCARPFVTSGIASTPPVPVLVDTPVPSPLNQVSIVKVAVPSPLAWPKVTKSFEPSKSSAVPATGPVGVGVAVAVAVGVGVGVAVGVGVVVGVGVAPDRGKPDTQRGPLVAVPLMPLPEESATDVPDPSFMPQRPINPVAEETSIPFVPLISACVRATFQMRASSRTPLKKPAAVPVESMAVARAA